MRIMPPIDAASIPAVTTNTPTPGQGTVYPSGLTNGCGTLYFLNKSNFGLLLMFEDGSVVSIPAWFARPFKVKNKSNQLWIVSAYMLNIASPPIQQLWYEAYQANEDATGLYSGPIPYQSTVGGNVTSTVSGISNQGETPPIDVIFDQPAGYSSPTIHLTDLGQLLLALKNNAATQYYLDLASLDIPQEWQVQQLTSGTLRVRDITHGITVFDMLAGGGVRASSGLFIVDSAGNITGVNLTSMGQSSLDNGAIATDGTGLLELLKNLAAGNVAYLKIAPADTPAVEFDFFVLGASDNSLDIHDTSNGASAVQLLGTKGVKARARGMYRGPWSRFTGSGSGTYSHGLGVTPNHVTPIVNVAGSATQGYDTATSTQVHITLGAALSFDAEATVLQS